MSLCGTSRALFVLYVEMYMFVIFEYFPFKEEAVFLFLELKIVIDAEVLKLESDYCIMVHEEKLK